MKATIEGKTYNTETATELAEYSNGESVTDFNHWCESLYRTKKGNYFIAGSGGAMSKYSVAVGNNGRGGSSKITPITEAEALAWCERYECEDAIAEHFSHLTEEA